MKRTLKQIWIPAAIIFTGKMLWLVFTGMKGEVDSVSYLTLESAIHQPPGYKLFAGGLAALTGSAWIVIILQSLAFALACAWALESWLSRKDFRIAGACILAADPCTGLLCTDIMSESLFIALVIPVLIIATRYSGWKAAVAAGVLFGAACLLRNSGLMILAVFIAWLPFSGFGWKKALLFTGSMILCMQLLFLPYKIYFRQNFGTWKTSVYFGASVWNVTSWMYPGSEVQKNPANDWEKYLQSYPDTAFSITNSLGSEHIFGLGFPFTDFCVKNQLPFPSGDMELSGKAAKTAFRLFSERPVYFFSKYYFKNLVKPLSQSEYFLLEGSVAEYSLKQKAGSFVWAHYVYWYFWPWCVLLTGLAAWCLFTLRSVDRAALLLVMYAALTWMLTALVGSMFLRYLYALSPFILLAAFIILEKDFLKLKPQAGTSEDFSTTP